MTNEVIWTKIVLERLSWKVFYNVTVTELFF